MILNNIYLKAKTTKRQSKLEEITDCLNENNHKAFEKMIKDGIPNIQNRQHQTKKRNLIHA